MKLRVNKFTEAEWPRRPPASYNHMDIGEEQSSSHVVSIAWSPPGLALHRRSVLAVLTANNILSLWASQSDMKDQASWKRVLIINNALKTSRASIRCIAWSPTTLKGLDEQILQEKPQWIPFMLATAQGGDPAVRVLGIISPQLGSGHTGWSVSEIACFNPSNYALDYQAFSLLDKELAKAAFVDHVSFGPTKSEDSTYQTIIFCRFRGILTHVVLNMARTSTNQSSTQSVVLNKSSFPEKLNISLFIGTSASDIGILNLEARSYFVLAGAENLEIFSTSNFSEDFSVQKHCSESLLSRHKSSATDSSYDTSGAPLLMSIQSRWLTSYQTSPSTREGPISSTLEIPSLSSLALETQDL